MTFDNNSAPKVAMEDQHIKMIKHVLKFNFTPVSHQFQIFLSHSESSHFLQFWIHASTPRSGSTQVTRLGNCLRNISQRRGALCLGRTQNEHRMNTECTWRNEKQMRRNEKYSFLFFFISDFQHSIFWRMMNDDAQSWTCEKLNHNAQKRKCLKKGSSKDYSWDLMHWGNWNEDVCVDCHIEL